MQGEGTCQKKTKQCVEDRQPAKSAQRKGLYQGAKPLEDYANKNTKFENKYNTLPVFSLHGPRYDRNSFNVMR